MICKLCNKPQEDINYVFCGISHQQVYYFFIELRTKTMNHPFTKDINNPASNSCGMCGRSAIEHTAGAQCESCKRYRNCNLFNNQLLCDIECFPREQSKTKESLVDRAEDIAEQLSIMQRATSIDARMLTSADYFNAETIAHNDVKKEIYADASLSETEKSYKWQKFIVSRLVQYREALMPEQEVVYKRQNEILALENTVRTFANELREEFRNKIRESDANYVTPINKPVKAKVKTVKKDPFELMVEAYAKMANCTEDVAREKLKQNMNPQKQ